MRNHTTTLQENVKLEAEDFPRMPPQKQHTLPNNKNVENTHTLATTNPQIDIEKNNQTPHARAESKANRGHAQTAETLGCYCPLS